MLNINSFLEKHFKKNEPVILGCSTGPDSMFLLYQTLKTPYRKNLIACYFNHKLRPEADEEEKFLKDLGKKEGFKVEIGEWERKNVKRGGKECQKMRERMSEDEGKNVRRGIQKISEDKGNLEEKARIARYGFFDEILDKYKTNKIILAHHLDDKIETFFFNLVRGTKLTGLINMKEEPKVESGKLKDNALHKTILRPLLNIEKREIQKYLDENNLKYFIDSSNFDVKITRNKLRLEILPPFAKINKNYKENIANLINYLEEVKENIDEEVKRFLSLPISYDMLFPTSKMKNSKIKKKFYVILGNEKRQNPPNLLYQGGKEQNIPNPIYQGGKEQTSPNPSLSRRGINQSPLDKGGQRGVFEISAFNSLSSFMQKEVIRYIYFISNGNSTIGLTESNINEIIKFINGKNNKTIKEIGGLKMRKENKIILY